jgi:hypothetical protein
MMMLSGYTLGFFFPKQVKHIAANPPKAPSVRESVRGETERTDARPVLTGDGGEVPASFYFYRYF